MIKIQVNDVLTLKDGKQFIVVEFENDLYCVNDEYYFKAFCGDDKTVEEWDFICALDDFEIVEIRRPEMPWELMQKTWNKAPVIWERKEINLNDYERMVLEKALMLGYEWITKDRDNTLCVQINEPYKSDNYWIGSYMNVLYDEDNDFKFVKWSDNEPLNIEKILKDDAK